MSYFEKTEPRLPLPTKRIMIHGKEIEEYIIPDNRRADVLEMMYLFDPVPSLEEERLDLHSGKLFVVRNYRVTRERGRNWLVSPYYEEGGGTVIDWMPADWANADAQDSETEDWIEDSRVTD